MRLIDADELKKWLERWKGYLDDDMIQRMQICSKDIPTIEERKKGYWEYVDDVDYRCSACHKYAYGCLGEVLSGHYKYCPYCGAAMEGEEDDE